MIKEMNLGLVKMNESKTNFMEFNITNLSGKET